MSDEIHPPHPEVVAYYSGYAEEDRLRTGAGPLEFERTREILARELPAPPARVLDVGGAAGVYASWLAELGHDVHLVDLTPRLVEEARRRNAGAPRPIASIEVGDARRLRRSDASADVVLLMGPLYHMTHAADRGAAIAEAFRVLVPGGVLVAAAISRYAPALGGMAAGLARDPQFAAIRDRVLVDGEHRNDTGRPEYFTTAYTHRPEDLAAELAHAGFSNVRVVGVEGAGWLLPDLDARWADDAAREELLATARLLAFEPSLLGASAHLLGVARRR